MTTLDPDQPNILTDHTTMNTVPDEVQEGVRSERAKSVDRFDDELNDAIATDTANRKQTAVFVFEVEPIELKIWDQNTTRLPEISESVLNAVSGAGSDITCSAVAPDVFVGFVSDLSESEMLAPLKERIMNALAEPIVIEGAFIHVDIRLGLAGSDSSTAGNALENARVALQTTSSDNPGAIYNQVMARQRDEDANLEFDFKLALSGGLIDVVFQPILSLTENRIAGVEAFARWTHPDLGEILPSHFLNIAERSDTIGQLGQQVLVKAMRAADRWTQHDELTNIVLWVNFSPTEIAHPEFGPTIKSVIKQYPRVQLGLELAESSVIEEKVISTTLKHLRAFGVRTSVDDFSSKDTAVARLRALPFDNVKIGRDLVRTLTDNRDDQAIVELLTELGSRSNFTVSAVGIENEEQLSLVRSLGVDCAQGYFLARPATEREIDNLLVATLTTR